VTFDIQYSGPLASSGVAASCTDDRYRHVASLNH
jgi:hypothetical protein